MPKYFFCNDGRSNFVKFKNEKNIYLWAKLTYSQWPRMECLYLLVIWSEYIFCCNADKDDDYDHYDK